MTRRHPAPSVASASGDRLPVSLAANLAHGDIVLVPVALAIRTDTCWLARPVYPQPHAHSEPVVRVDLDAEVPLVARHRPASVVTGEVADPLTEVRR